DERQGHHRCRPDAADHHEHVALRTAMIRIAIFIVAAVIASAAAAQFADTSLLSPVPLASESWAARAVATPVRATPELPRAAAVPALRERAEPPRPTLKRAVTVTGEIVRIGDLVENAGVVAEVAIFRAPDLGHSGSVPAARVVEAVRPHHITQL